MVDFGPDADDDDDDDEEEEFIALPMKSIHSCRVLMERMALVVAIARERKELEANRDPSPLPLPPSPPPPPPPPPFAAPDPLLICSTCFVGEIRFGRSLDPNRIGFR